MAINQFNYLDFGNLLINELFGNFWLFLIVTSLILLYFAIINNLDTKGILMLLLVYGVGMSSYYYNPSILVILAMVFAYFVYLVFARFLR